VGFLRKVFPPKRITVAGIFLVSLLLVIAAFFIRHMTLVAVFAWLTFIVTGCILLWRGVRYFIRRSIWRLRNRLIVTYMFIGMVPLTLLLLLVGLGVYVFVGQTAVYLVMTELEQTMEGLKVPGRVIAANPGAPYEDIIKQVAPFVRDRFQDFQIVVQNKGQVYRYPAGSTLTGAKPEVPDYTGLTIVDGKYCAWSHAKKGDLIVDVVAPVQREMMAELVPHLGRISISGDGGELARRKPNPDQLREGDIGSVPPPASQIDPEVTWASPVMVVQFGSAEEKDSGYLLITTRPSALIHAIFSEKFEVAQAILYAFLVIAVLFLMVEIISFIIGLSLTRSITGNIAKLYEGTQRVSEGDFSHRITIKGRDQLAAVNESFNGMTERLEQLVIVAKEKERLESEIEIAREVQSQLFPQHSPHMKSLEISGLCRPARMVSGDYYDFLCLQETNLAVAIGDVAGKGISAALLMAAIQSIMRTQLTSSTPMLGASANGGPHAVYSTSKMVSQLSRQLYLNTSPEKYATFLFGIYDEDDRVFTYTNAGHLPPILIRRGEPTLLEVTGTVVGLFPSSGYEERKLGLEKGDLLVCYTDGITEPENEYGEEFGTDRLIQTLIQHKSLEIAEMTIKVMDAVRNWTSAPELPDDMTLMLARRNE
jgi:sigma-B regulation protein RsbU (phosphoserine phosphatase)